MTCHQHRCCRRPTSAGAGDGAAGATIDYVLLSAADANLAEGAAMMLRGAGAPVEWHELGLRLGARGNDYTAALAHLADTLAPSARRAVRVAPIPVGADADAVRKALLRARSLESFLPCGERIGSLLGDVFKGESLE